MTNSLIDFIMKPWPWWFSGTVIAVVMFIITFFGKSFGFSSNLRTICTLAGAGKKVKFFDFDWKTQSWNLLFLVGTFIGGYVAKEFLSYQEEPVAISEKTIERLEQINFAPPAGMQPAELVDWTNVVTLKGFLILSIAGLLIGFGSRYAGGCTSGHAISGLSNLQVPSLVAVIGFFIGGILMSHFILPLLF